MKICPKRCRQKDKNLTCIRRVLKLRSVFHVFIVITYFDIFRTSNGVSLWLCVHFDRFSNGFLIFNFQFVCEIAEKTAVANDQEHRAEHLASKIHLFKKEQV